MTSPAALAIDDIIRFFEEITPESVARFGDYYSDDAYFKDPFNEVHGLLAVQHIFTHMFQKVAEPRFVVTEKMQDAGGAMLIWDFYYRVQLWGKGQTQIMRGASHLRFNADGKVCYHRDYWDTGEELYMKLPLLGVLMRGLRRALAA
jgi:ketosteroid isomerase-like protein